MVLLCLIRLYKLCTGCPNKQGNKVTTFISSSIHAAFFYETNYCNIPA